MLPFELVRLILKHNVSVCMFMFMLLGEYMARVGLFIITKCFLTWVKCMHYFSRKGKSKRNTHRERIGEWVCNEAGFSPFLSWCFVLLSRMNTLYSIHGVVNIFKCTHSTRAYFTGENGCEFLFCFRFDLVLVVLDVTMQYIFFSCFLSSPPPSLTLSLLPHLFALLLTERERRCSSLLIML